MDTRHLIVRLVADLDPPARPMVTEYLQDLASALPASHSTVAAILTEMADGLIQQITDTPGVDPAMAARTAIHTFGSPQYLATQFARELTGKAAHHTGLGLVVSGPVVGTAWLLALTNRPSNATHTLPERITELFTAVPVLPLLLLIAIPAALVAITGAGRFARHLPVTTGTAGLAGFVAGIVCVIADLTLIGHVLVSGGEWSLLLIAVVAISMTRLVLAAAAARRCALLWAG